MRRINYKSDIPPLLLSLKVDENQITVPNCDFIVRFYIEGYEGRHYDCSHIGGVWSNCEPSEDGTKLVCYINNQRLGIGELCAEFHYISPDMRYSDGSQKSVVIIDSTELGVELVEDNGDAVTEAAIDVTLPFIYRTAYEIARDHGYTGTAEDFYSALASVVGIADAEKKRVTAEITRNANEQERIENEENRLNAENERVNAEAQRVRNEKSFEDAIRDQVNNYKPIVIEGNVTNAADEEDITSENGLLKLKNRSALNGMGYVILRQNKDFAEQVTKANTIYEIRYDFDLNGAEITIPENCVLKFNGGSLSNCTINGNLYNIDAQRYKIFENINIKGAAKLNNYYLIDWWVKTPQYEFIKENNPIDNYKDIQSAFNSGAENFIFSSDRYYYIKKTLLINGEINLFSDVEHKHFDGNDRDHRKEPPCIYSNEIITLIEYKYKSDTYKCSIYIGTINLVCNKPFSDLSEKDTPILYIHGDSSTVNTTVWGVVIKCNIKAKDLVIDLKNEYPDIYEQSVNIYAPNYTGLMIKGDYVNFSYIKICSYICMTYYGIIIPNTENNHWITDVTIEGDTRCVIGGKFIGGGNPVRIFGSHQPEYALAKTDKVRNIGYFSGEYIQLYGYVWDINQDTLPENGNCPKYPVEILNTDGDYNNPLVDNTILSPAIRFIKNADLNFRNVSIKAQFSDNLLNYAGSPLLANVIEDFSLKLDNKDYTEYPQIYNTRYLFGTYPWIIDVYTIRRKIKNIAYIITQSDEEIPYKLHFKLNSLGYTDGKELIIKCDSNSVYIRVQTDDGDTIIDGTYNLISSFYINSYYSILLPAKNVLVDIEFKIRQPKGTFVFLPLIKVPSMNTNVFNNKANISDIKGDFIYDTATNKAGWWNGEYWADINGYNIDYNVKGTTANRPTLKSTDDGFEYYDTTLKKKIIWNGTEWTNIDGTNLI